MNSAYTYTVDQWILLFFAYAFAGYLWEIFYVSLSERRFCNRGFLYGPILPIYGFGAIIILHAALPVYESEGLIFLFGMLSTTLLEFVTGALMERFFRVRYWDYSKDIGNIKGYICPRASLAWGVFSILLVRLIHPAFDALINRFSIALAGILAHALVLGFAIDTTISVRDVLDLRALIIKLAEEDERVARLRTKAETIKARADAKFAFSDLNQNGIPDNIEELRSRIGAGMKRLLKRNPTAKLSELKFNIRNKIRK